MRPRFRCDAGEETFVPRDAGGHVIIIGGGASGVLLAHQLLSGRSRDVRTTIIEMRPEIGRGVAYRTANPAHLLNVHAANMSALPDDPSHFLRWLDARDPGSGGGVPEPRRTDPLSFVSRRVYGDYIASLIEPILSESDRSPRLRIIEGECLRISQRNDGITAVLADGRRITGDVGVLATGHETPSMPEWCYADPWIAPCDAGIPSDAAVLILGTGLTMVDYVLALLLGGHRGPIIAMSRRGLLPRSHRDVEPLQIEAKDLPSSTNFTVLFRWVRQLAKAEMARGGDWRSVIDGLRPFSQRMWRDLSFSSKRRFIEHARAWWDVHRHRMAPEIERRIDAAIGDGALTIIAGKVRAIEANARSVLVCYRRRGENIERSLQVGRIVDCTGLIKNPLYTANPALRSLLGQGLARIDPLQIGFEVTAECALVDQFGVPSWRLFAIGPLTRAAFWEVTAVPDIRNQCAALAARLHAILSCAAEPPTSDAAVL
jgi:uncharacterized NAD(P)/FAD-binding protein YdhS